MYLKYNKSYYLKTDFKKEVSRYSIGIDRFIFCVNFTRHSDCFKKIVFQE